VPIFDQHRQRHPFRDQPARANRGARSAVDEMAIPRGGLPWRGSSRLCRPCSTIDMPYIGRRPRSWPGGGKSCPTGWTLAGGAAFGEFTRPDGRAALESARSHPKAISMRQRRGLLQPAHARWEKHPWARGADALRAQIRQGACAHRPNRRGEGHQRPRSAAAALLGTARHPLSGSESGRATAKENALARPHLSVMDFEKKHNKKKQKKKAKKKYKRKKKRKKKPKKKHVFVVTTIYRHPTTRPTWEWANLPPPAGAGRQGRDRHTPARGQSRSKPEALPAGWRAWCRSGAKVGIDATIPERHSTRALRAQSPTPYADNGEGGPTT